MAASSPRSRIGLATGRFETLPDPCSGRHSMAVLLGAWRNAISHTGDETTRQKCGQAFKLYRNAIATPMQP
jgi:hypothetical protein